MHRSGVAAGVVVPVGVGVLARIGIGVPGGVGAGAKPPPPVCVGGDVVAVGSGTPVGVGGDDWRCGRDCGQYGRFSGCVFDLLSRKMQVKCPIEAKPYCAVRAAGGHAVRLQGGDWGQGCPADLLLFGQHGLLLSRYALLFHRLHSPSG